MNPWMPRPVFGRRARRHDRFDETAIDSQVIADLLRAAADGRQMNGDIEGARRARAGARIIEGRDGPGERYRKHRRTRLKGT